MRVNPSPVKHWFWLPLIFAVAYLRTATAPGSGNAPPPDAPGTPQVQGADTQPDSPPAMTPARLFEKVSPAVVRIVIKDDDEKEIGSGSGFVIRAITTDVFDLFNETYYVVVTNYHVIRSAVSASVQFANGGKGEVKRVFAEDENVDLAVLGVLSPYKVPQPLTLSSATYPPVGTSVFAIGSPKGLTNTLSTGMISGYRSTGQAGKWIQITTPISPGSSGGPLLSSEGTVIGVTTASLPEGQNLNFAVPESEIQRLLDSNPKGRHLWKGTSISKEVYNAYHKMSLRLYGGCTDDRPCEEKGWEQCLERKLEAHIETKAAAGDPLALLHKGQTQFAAGEHGRAIATLTRAVRAKPGEYAYLAYYYLGKAHYGRGLESALVDQSVFDEAIGAFKTAKSLNPDFAPTFHELCRCNMRVKRYPEALVAAEFLLRLVPRCADAYAARGDVYMELERNAAALADYREVVALRPTYAYAVYQLGSMYRVVGQWQKAIETLEEGIQLDGAHKWMFYEGFGRAYENGEKFAMARAYYEKALKEYQMLGMPESWVSELKASIANCRMRGR